MARRQRRRQHPRLPLPPASAAPTTGSATGVTVQLASTDDLGDVLVDGEGRTLYAFTPDEETGEPTCYDDCAGNWPPLISSGEITVGEGLDDSSFTTVPRTDDAGDQVAIGHWPLYYFANDSAPGDVNGQGVGDVWFVVGADGELSARNRASASDLTERLTMKLGIGSRESRWHLIVVVMRQSRPREHRSLDGVRQGRPLRCPQGARATDWRHPDLLR